MPAVEALAWGALGAALIHAAPFFPRTITRHGEVLGEATWGEYLTAGVVRVAAGALFAFAYAHDVSDMTVILAMNIGAAWPAIIHGLKEAVPSLTPPQDRTG